MSVCVSGGKQAPCELFVLTTWHLHTDGVEEEIRRAEGVEATVAALLRTSNRDVTIAALALLRSLSANSDIESLIVSLDVIPHLVSLVAQQEDQLLRRDATKTIRSLSFSNEAKIIVRNAGGIPVLLACLSEEDLEIRKSAMKAIMVLSINGLFVSNSVYCFLCAYVKTHIQSVCVSAFMCLCLCVESLYLCVYSVCIRVGVGVGVCTSECILTMCVDVFECLCVKIRVSVCVGLI